MARLFAVGGLFVDIAGTMVSLGGDADQFAMPVWIGINVLLLVLPLAIRLTEPLWSAMGQAEVLSIDTASSRH